MCADKTKKCFKIVSANINLALQCLISAINKVQIAY